jgi:hypothetical protein
MAFRGPRLTQGTQQLPGAVLAGKDRVGAAAQRSLLDHSNLHGPRPMIATSIAVSNLEGHPVTVPQVFESDVDEILRVKEDRLVQVVALDEPEPST